MDKKLLAAARARLALHVALILHLEKCSKAIATAMAYHEGSEGLDKRLGQGKLPLEPEKK